MFTDGSPAFDLGNHCNIPISLIIYEIKGFVTNCLKMAKNVALFALSGNDSDGRSTGL